MAELTMIELCRRITRYTKEAVALREKYSASLYTASDTGEIFANATKCLKKYEELVMTMSDLLGRVVGKGGAE